jgi:hypothetical protein
MQIFLGEGNGYDIYDLSILARSMRRGLQRRTAAHSQSCLTSAARRKVNEVGVEDHNQDIREQYASKTRVGYDFPGRLRPVEKDEVPSVPFYWRRFKYREHEESDL